MLKFKARWKPRVPTGKSRLVHSLLRPSDPVSSQEVPAALARAIAEIEASGVDTLVYSGLVSYEGFDSVVGEAPSQKGKNVLVLLVTLGGNADAAYRIIRYLRRAYEKVTVYVPSLCKSAGTLICIGAHELVISETGELGPLDVQIREQNELFAVRSGLAIPQALDFLESRMVGALRSVLVDVAGGGGLGTERASHIAVNTTVGLFAPIYSKIDPARLGEAARALAVAEDYARRLPGNLHRGALERLVSDYSSHSFVIDSEETAELFQNVRGPNEHETTIADHFGLLATSSAFQSPRPVVCYITSGADEKPTHGENYGRQGTDPTDPTGAVGPSEESGSGDVKEGSDEAEG